MAHRSALMLCLAAATGCVADDSASAGECQASTECIGTPEGRVCDPSRFIGEPAALCIARSHGLATGLRGLQAGLGYNYGHRRVIWAVFNVLVENGPAWQGGLFVIDA